MDRSQDPHHPIGMVVGFSFGNESMAGLEHVPHF